MSLHWRLRLCNAILESVTNGLDHTPLGEWTEQRLHEHTDGMYRATELARKLNVMRQNIPFVPSGTLLELEKMPPDQHLILKGMLDASPAIYGHVMAQMISNPSLPIHTPNLPSQAKLLDANTRLLVTQGHYPSFNECVPGHTTTGGDCNRGLTSVLRKHNMKVEFESQVFLDTTTGGDCIRGLTSVLRKHNMKVEFESQVFLDANPAGLVYADEYTEGDIGRPVSWGTCLTALTALTCCEASAPRPTVAQYFWRRRGCCSFVAIFCANGDV